VAVDLGCGAGGDTAELLRRGWHVIAVDAEAEAIERLRRRTDLGPRGLDRLETVVARFQDAVWPPVDLVNASWALPFCPPGLFTQVWRRVVASLDSGGRFSGQLFGDRDGWRRERDLTFVTSRRVSSLLRSFEAERLDEIEEDGTTALGEPKHWHVFHVVARKL
jgi:tellurite methyltransferase